MMPTEQEIIDALLVIANTALSASVRATTPGDVPSPKPVEFVTLNLVRRGGDRPSRAGRYSITGWAAYFMAASSRDGGFNARDSLRRIDAAIDGATVTAGGLESTPITFDNARPVGPDDGWFSGVHVYHFAI